MDDVNVGPFHCAHVPDNVRGGTVGRDNIPVILYESRDREGVKQERYAVMLPPTKDPKRRIGVVCAGCYKPGMTLWDISRCVNCRTFVNHLDPVLMEDPKDRRKKIPVLDIDGLPVRKRKCGSDGEEYSLTNAVTRAGTVSDLHVTRNLNCPVAVNLKDVPVEHLLQALKDKQELTTEVNDAFMIEMDSSDLLHGLKGKHPNGLAGFLNHIEDEDILAYIKEVQERDPKRFKEKRKGTPSRLVVGASFEYLEAEMRRKADPRAPTVKRFYCDVTKRKKGEPHSTDPGVVTWAYVCDAMYDRAHPRSLSQS